jgi:hypothetical protein
LKDEVHYIPLLLALAGVERRAEPRPVLQIPKKCVPMLIITKIFSTRHAAALQMLPTHKLGQLCSPSGGGGAALQRQRYRI